MATSYAVGIRYSAAPREGAVRPTVRRRSQAIADLGAREAIRRCPALARGVNLAAGRVTHPALAEARGLESARLEEIASLVGA
jgi:alanine dehydrogenase